ncbi:TRAP transporter substrate-binding protein [bacterium]|nr:TRAP transporter substrate-binding protein [bacterium]
MTERREFLKKAGVFGGSALAFGCNSEQKQTAIHTKKTYEWKMVTTWSPHFPILGEGADKIAKWIEEMSDGRMKIQVYGGGELVPPFESFDAVSGGIAEMSHGASYYWAGKSAATQFFASVPFGMNAQQMHSWIYFGGGLQLWEELYAPFNLVPMPAGNTGAQMGGWFNREINSLSDLSGLKMRMPGLGGKVIAKAGSSAILSPGSEIYTNLERGVIDATEWIGPYHDYLMGFHKIAKFYYYPGWHEPCGTMELLVNKTAFDALPKDLQTIIRTAAGRATAEMLVEFDYQNQIYLQKLKTESKVQIRKFPDEVLEILKNYTKEVIEEIILQDSNSKKIYESYSKFQYEIKDWIDVSEKN